jgi:hypothetical protein
MCSQQLELMVDLPDLDIPDMYSTVIPSPNAHTPVTRFQFHVLQPQLNSLVFPSAAASFSIAPPSGTYNLSNLSKAPIPPTSYLRSLKAHIIDLAPGDRLPFHSIHDPANTKELLPLWILTVWEEVSRIAGAQDKWKASYSWVTSLQNTCRYNDCVATTFAHLEVLGWNSPVSLYGLRGITNLSLAQFLADDRVDDEAIDLMSRFLAAKSTLPHDTLIADLRLPRFISARDHAFRPPPAHICELEEQITCAAVLYFPMFYAKYQHWVAFKVDLLRKEVTYGKFDNNFDRCCVITLSYLIADSMGNTLNKPEEFISALLRWLSACCGGKFTFIGKKLQVGSQRDSTSCGFFAINAVSHSVFNATLLTHQDVRENRLQWFNDLCDAVAHRVTSSRPFCETPSLIVFNL